MVVAAGAGVGDGGDLDGLHDVAAVAHTVLDRQVVPRGGGAHLEQPGPGGRRIEVEVLHVVCAVITHVLQVLCAI